MNININIIVAASENNIIGVNNKMPWHLHADLQNFKKTTTNKCIIMGRKTFESLGNKALPSRVNIVLSNNQNLIGDNIVIRNSLESALAYCTKWQQLEVFVIGGDNIYKQFLDITNKIYLTRVHTVIENGDAFFPALNKENWEIISAERHEKDEKNDFDFTFEVYEKRQKENIIYK